MGTLEKNTKKVVIFPHYREIEPKQLIEISEEYLSHIPTLMNFIIRNEGTEVQLLFVQIEKNKLNPSKKIITGVVKNIEENHFTFISTENIRNVYDRKIETEIRLDNVFGMLPLLPSASDINPYHKGGTFALGGNYSKTLSEMHTLLRSCIGTQHAAKLFYRYSQESGEVFKNGNHCIECEISNVNKSNVEYKHIRTIAFINKEKSYVDIRKRNNVEHYVNPDKYLYKVEVELNRTHKINPYDDED